MYDYYLGGKDHFPVDREAAEKVIAAAPEARLMAGENRAFLQRAVRFLVEDAGIRQILDIGTGIPASGNVHEVAQKIAPDTRVVYVDNDPIVHVHANALLTRPGPAFGATGVVLADLRDPEKILTHPTVTGMIDFTRPVGLFLIAILHFIDDAEDPYRIVRTLLDALPAGSYLALSHATGDLRTQAAADVTRTYAAATSGLTVRGFTDILGFFDGCVPVSPGLVPVPLWRHTDPPPAGHDDVWIYGGVGRKDDPPDPDTHDGRG
jgi:S-adenosyl methyltransferase